MHLLLFSAVEDESSRAGPARAPASVLPSATLNGRPTIYLRFVYVILQEYSPTPRLRVGPRSLRRGRQRLRSRPCPRTGRMVADPWPPNRPTRAPRPNASRSVSSA